MKLFKARKNNCRRKRIITFGLCFGMLASLSVIATQINKNDVIKVEAADYSGGSSGFVHQSDGSIKATFTVSDNDLDMRGWLLCLLTSKPSVGTNNKISNSQDKHPYSYDLCAHYFFASSTAKTGSITVTWAANAADQGPNGAWSASESSGASGKTLKSIIENGYNWHLAVGPRHYQTGWGASGIGEGTNGYWENCDYYIGALNNVFPTEDQDMTVNVTSPIVTYDGTNKSINISVTNPSSGYSIAYRTTSSGSYNLTSNPTFTDAGEYDVYFKITANGYKDYQGSGSVTILKANAVYTAPTGKSNLFYNGENQPLVSGGSSNVVYSLNNSTYSSDVPTGKNVGEYKVYYKVLETTNYKGVSASSLMVYISPNDKSELNSEIALAKLYKDSISSDFPSVANQLNDAISEAELVSEEDNKTVDEIETSLEELTYAYDLAHSQISDILIDAIGDVRYTDNCLEDILLAEACYDELTDEQKELVNSYSDLLSARNLYNRLKNVALAINDIGEVTYDEETYERINEAKEALATLTNEEQMLIPTLFNELNSAEDIYDMLALIANLGEVTYSDEFEEALLEARNAYDALDLNEQKAIYNYQDLLDAEEAYQDVDNVVNLVNEIAEVLEYVGTHHPDIDKAKEAYNLLSEPEKLLVPEEIVNALTSAIEEYEEIKIEHEIKEIEDREAGVAIAIEGGSGIPATVSIDINNSQSNEDDFKDNIDYQTIQETIASDEVISSICEIQFYDEVDGELVEISLADLDENMSITIKIDVPLDVDPDNFKVVLLDEDNNIIEMDYTYDPVTRQATVNTNKLGTFAIVSGVRYIEPTVEKEGLGGAIVLVVLVIALFGTITYISIRKLRKEKNG